MIRCINCGGLSDDNALACKYCGRTFPDRRWKEIESRMRQQTDWDTGLDKPTERSAATKRTMQNGRSAVPPKYDYSALGLLIIMLLTGILLLDFIELIVVLIRLFY